MNIKIYAILTLLNFLDLAGAAMLFRLTFVFVLLYSLKSFSVSNNCLPLFKNEQTPVKVHYSQPKIASSANAFYRQRYQNYPKSAHKFQKPLFKVLSKMLELEQSATTLSASEARYLGQITPRVFHEKEILKIKDIEDILLGINYRLAFKFARLRRDLSVYENSSNSKDDFVQAAMIGLLTGIRSYAKDSLQIDKGEFSTVAWNHMRHSTSINIATGSTGIFKNYRSAILIRLSTIKTILTRRFKREPRDNEVIKEFNLNLSKNKRISKEVYHDLMHALFVEASLLRDPEVHRVNSEYLDETIYRSAADELIPDKNSPHLEQYASEQIKADLQLLMEHLLTPDQFETFSFYYGINGYRHLNTLKNTGQIFGVTREAIRRRMKLAIKNHLKHESLLKDMAADYDTFATQQTLLQSTPLTLRKGLATKYLESLDPTTRKTLLNSRSNNFNNNSNTDPKLVINKSKPEPSDLAGEHLGKSWQTKNKTTQELKSSNLQFVSTRPFENLTPQGEKNITSNNQYGKRRSQVQKIRTRKRKNRAPSPRLRRPGKNK